MLEFNRRIFTQIDVWILRQNFHIIQHLYMINKPINKKSTTCSRCIYAGRMQDQKLPATLDDDANPLSLLSNTPQEKGVNK